MLTAFLQRIARQIFIVAVIAIAFLFWYGKPAVKRGSETPCYPMNMEIFLAVTLTAIMIVLIVDTRQKRHDFLCQQEATSKHH